MSREKLLGAFGEAVAAEYLRKKRYEILGMNYRCRLGELDIIARQKDTIVFVEVKTRTEGGLGRPMDAVDRNKQRCLRLAAAHWIAEHGMELRSTRFDVIEVLLPSEQVYRLENAF